MRLSVILYVMNLISYSQYYECINSVNCKNTKYHGYCHSMYTRM